MEYGDTTSPIRKRKRPALSCVECRRRKIRCDRAHPCSQCRTINSRCTFTQFHDLRPGASDNQRPQSQNALASRPAAARTPPEVPQTPHPPTASEDHIILPPLKATGDFFSRPRHSDVRAESYPNVTIPDLQRLKQHQQREPTDLAQSSYGLSHMSTDLLAKQIGLRSPHIVLNKTRTLRWSHWTGSAAEFGTLFSLYSKAMGNSAIPKDPEMRDVIIQMRELIVKCKNTAHIVKAARPTNAHLSPPQRKLADTAASLYLEFESVFRIQHFPTFQAEYKEYWENVSDAPVELQLKVLLSIAIGASLHEYPDIEAELQMRDQVHSWIYAAHEWLYVPKKDKLSVSSLQIYCLIMLARQLYALGGDLIWTSTGDLVNRAMQIGLHRDPKYLPEMTVLEAEVRRRLWATILELVVQSSIDSALPTRISMEDFDTLPPANVNDRDVDENTTTLHEQPIDDFTDCSMQIKLLEWLPERLTVLKRMTGLHSGLTYPDAMAFGSKLIIFQRQCSALTKSQSPFRRSFLEYLAQRLIIPLYCPFANQARQNPLFQHAMTECLDSALNLIHPEASSEFSRLAIRSGGMIRETTRYATSVLTLAMLQEIDSERRNRGKGVLGQQSRMLKNVVLQLRQQDADRIRHGETNIKGYMFFSMALAQADGHDEKGLLVTARDSLEKCLELLEVLKARVRPGTVSDNLPELDLNFDIDFEQFLGFHF